MGWKRVKEDRKTREAGPTILFSDTNSVVDCGGVCCMK